jgi:hypothetical protein
MSIISDFMYIYILRVGLFTYRDLFLKIKWPPLDNLSFTVLLLSERFGLEFGDASH